LDCPLRGLPYSFPLAAVCWSDGALQNIKFQAPNFKVSGVGCQVSGKKNKKLKPEHLNLKPLLPAKPLNSDLALRRSRYAGKDQVFDVE
jgi:hypothetical protein